MEVLHYNDCSEWLIGDYEMFLSTKEFSYSAKDRQFSAFASDLLPTPVDVMKPVYKDSCDEGFYLTSHKTGKEVGFVLNHTEWKDGDMMFQVFIPVNKHDPQLAGITVKIFNDWQENKNPS